MTADVPQIAFGNVSLKSNSLQIGGSVYALSSVTGIHFWEDNTREASAARARKAMFWSFAITATLYFVFEWANANMDSPLSVLGVVAVLLFWPMVFCSTLSIVVWLFYFLKAKSHGMAGHSKSRLTVSLSDGASHTVSGSPADLQALQSAMQQAMGAR